MTGSFGSVERVRALERRLVRGLDLRPLPLEPVFAQLSGQFRGCPVVLKARVYAGPRIAYARMVEIEGHGLEIGNLLALSRPELALPILGVDFVDVGRDTAMIVGDLSPMTDDSNAVEAQLAALAPPPCAPPLPSRMELPAWASEWFSPCALSARISPEQAQSAGKAAGAFVTAFLELVRHAEENPHGADRISARQQRYAAAHRDRDRGLLLLRRMFEPSLADRLLREVLFPERIAS